MSFRSKRHEKISAQSKKAYENHRIIRMSDDRWLIAVPQGGRGNYDFNLATEIVCLWGNAIYVGGDIDHTIFRSGPRDPRQRVPWMGERSGANDQYFLEKAVIGTGRENVYEYCADVAEEDIEELIELVAEDHGDSADRYVESMRDVISTLDKSNRHDVIRELIDCNFEGEDIADVGMVVNFHVYHAYSALSKLNELLKEEQ